MECFRRAVAHCDTILNDVAGKPKDNRKELWRVQMKKVCEEDKNRLNTEINTIQPVIQEFEGHLAWHKAGGIYQRSLEPHPDANFWDHESLSPTFALKIR